MKDNTIAVIIACIVLAWMFLVSFGLWGGHPKGCFTLIGELNQENTTRKAEIATLKSELTNEIKSATITTLEVVSQTFQYAPKPIPESIPEHKKYKRSE